MQVLRQKIGLVSTSNLQKNLQSAKLPEPSSFSSAETRVDSLKKFSKLSLKRSRNRDIPGDENKDLVEINTDTSSKRTKLNDQNESEYDGNDVHEVQSWTPVPPTMNQSENEHNLHDNNDQNQYIPDGGSSEIDGQIELNFDNYNDFENMTEFGDECGVDGETDEDQGAANDKGEHNMPAYTNELSMSNFQAPDGLVQDHSYQDQDGDQMTEGTINNEQTLQRITVEEAKEKLQKIQNEFSKIFNEIIIVLESTNTEKSDLAKIFSDRSDLLSNRDRVLKSSWDSVKIGALNLTKKSELRMTPC